MHCHRLMPIPWITNRIARQMHIYIPAFLIICSIITMSFYHLDKEFPQIQKELGERRKVQNK